MGLTFWRGFCMVVMSHPVEQKNGVKMMLLRANIGWQRNNEKTVQRKSWRSKA